ncbi:CASP C terminal-domain-containing protein [Choanephora cucurbitarum]|nr:CASP C terminal-domain-containing protein [Choanephora cucurbitarum]
MNLLILSIFFFLLHREYDLQKQLNQALDQLTELKHSHDDTQAQLINHGQKYDEEVIGKLAELDMVTMDLERANGRIAHLEKKNEDLKQELAQLSGSQHESKHENDRHNAEVNKLIKDVETYKDLYKSTEARLTKKIKDLTGENQALLEERDNLKKKNKGYEDYDEIKRELQIMKFVEFSTGEEDGDFNATDVLKKEAVHDSLEVRLMEKNKKLENDYTQVKMALVDLQKEFELKAKEVDTAAKALQAKTTLVQRLEEDLLRLGQQSNHNNLSIGSISPLHRPKTPEGSLTPHTKDEKSILPIVMSQRDRFRQRNAELEERTRALETSLYDARTEVQNLKADNLKLYERLKFVHVWKEGELVNQRSSVAVNMDSSEPSNYPTRSFRRSSLKADDPSDKYGKLYEESMNPFTQFHKKEENRRYNALNPIEKLTLQLTRLLFSHKWSRYFFIMYSLLLHFLVVLTLYQLSLWECRHDHEAIQFPTNNDGLNRNSNGEV